MGLPRWRISRPHISGKRAMLVTFKSKAWNDVTMFSDDAVALLKMAGHSGTMPGALLPADIPSALERLKQEVAAAEPVKETNPAKPPQTDEADAPAPVELQTRAYPLIQLLAAAARQGCHVEWQTGAPVL